MNTISSLLKFIASFEPVGSIKMYAGSTAPSKWLICDGSAVSRTTYAKLFDAIGTTYGAGDGSTTFNLPNCSGRTAIGVSAGHTLGSTGGSENATLVSHTHSIGADGYHSHGFSGCYAQVSNITGETETGGSLSGTGSKYRFVNSAGAWYSIATTDAGGSHSHSISTVGDSATSANMQPFITVNYIIYAGA